MQNDAVDDPPLEQSEPPDQVAKRGRGRPKGTGGDFVPQFPTPARYQFLNGADFFGYLTQIPAEKRNRGMLTFYRYEPIMIETKPKHIRKIPLESFPVDEIKTNGWENVILHLFGSGKYGCYLKEMGLPPETGQKNTCECFDIKTRWDVVNYPPVIDLELLDYENRDNDYYITWLRNRGIKTPQDEDTDNIMLAEKILDQNATLINQAIRANTPVPPQPYRETASERLTAESAKAAIDIVRDEAKASRAPQSDPLAMINGVVGLVQNLHRPDDGTKVMLESLARQVEEGNKRNAALTDRMLDLVTKANAAPAAAAPKSLLEQLDEAKRLVDIFKGDKAEGGDSGGSGAAGGDLKTLVLQNLPATVQAAAVLVQTLTAGVVQVVRLNKGVAENPQQVAAAGQPQPQQQQAMPPVPNIPGMTEDEVRRFYNALAYICNPMLAHLARGENGYAFAQWFIDGQGEIAYETFRSKTRTDKGEVDITPLIAIIQTFPPIWEKVAGMEQNFRVFIGEFVTMKEYVAAHPEGQEEEVVN